MDTLSELPSIHIKSILPNPKGADSGKEEIALYRDATSNSQEFSEQFSEISLSPDFYLLINNKTKKKLNGILPPNQEITIKGTFSFPNSASCVTLMRGSDPIDSICYRKPKDGERFFSNNTSVQEIPAEDLAIVKKITLVRQKEKLCISYNKVIFGCRVIPNSTTEKNTKLLSFQNNYIAEVEKYIKNNYSLLYYNSELRNLFTLYTDTKREIKAGSYSVTRK
ncbi:MAG: hypothetical protein LBI53_01020 [Candidatus Peribacteria bacterium]|nr:hypothetical protein [Candidatus Peribacteria bacterium]